MIRASALCAERAGGNRVGQFLEAADRRRGALSAARRRPRRPFPGRSVPLVLWPPAAAKEAVDILVHSAGAAPAWDKALDSIISADQRQRDSVWAMVANAFAALADPHVLARRVSRARRDASTRPSSSAQQRHPVPARHRLGGGRHRRAGRRAVEDVVEVARRLAAAFARRTARPAAGSDPRRSRQLPAAQSLPALMSEGGGTGITTMAVLQSLAQARHRWGREAGPGRSGTRPSSSSSSPACPTPPTSPTSPAWSANRTEREVSETSQAGGGRSVSSSTRQRPILEPSALRALDAGTRPAAAAIGQTDRPHAATLDLPIRRRASAPRSCGAWRAPSGQRPSRTGLTVREPRPGLRWSGQRIALRARYADYMDSPAWYRRRELWLEAWTAAHDQEPTCAVCEAPWTLRPRGPAPPQLPPPRPRSPPRPHPLCNHCHLLLHAFLERSPAWRRLDRAQATDLIVALLRRRIEARHG